MTTEDTCAGFIALTFLDDATGQAVTIGGAGFVTQDQADAAWGAVPAFAGDSNFMADRLNAQRDVIDDRIVSAETCEALTGKPIAVLIQAGRAALAALSCRADRVPPDDWRRQVPQSTGIPGVDWGKILKAMPKCGLDCRTAAGRK